MRLVVLESPFAGNQYRTQEDHVRYAREALLDCIQRGEAPIASHLLITQVLNDNDRVQRERGIACGMAWIRRADAVVVYQDCGISLGMARAIQRAQECGVPIEYRSIEGWGG